MVTGQANENSEAAVEPEQFEVVVNDDTRNVQEEGEDDRGEDDLP